jgi:hypothetical protein
MKNDYAVRVKIVKNVRIFYENFGIYGGENVDRCQPGRSKRQVLAKRS